MKSSIIRVGDYVRIINPLMVTRVGYPLHWKDLMPDGVTPHPEGDKTLELADKAIDAMGLKFRHVPFYLLQVVAKLQVEAQRFGGSERMLHTQLVECYRGYRCQVTAKRKVYTGKRVYLGEEEGYGLEDRKAHVLLTLGYYGEFEACNLEKA